jgi:autotransporter-associated beta strand protein
MDCNGSVTGNLTVDSVNPLNFVVTSTTNDILNVSGSLTLSTTPVTLNVSVPGFKAAGTYRLINYVGAAIPTNSFNLNLVGVTAQTYVLSTTANQVNLVVVGVPKDLTWLGGSGEWDLASLNWTNSGGLTPTNFSTADNVLFDDSASAFVVTVNNSLVNVFPNNVVVSNGVNDYTIIGDGISTAGTLTKQGAAVLVFTSPSNSFTGPIDIQAGTLSVGSGGAFGALGAPTAVTNNGTFRLNLGTGGLTVNAPVSGSGAVEVLGTSTLTLTGSNSYTGLTTINDTCQLYVVSTNALGTTDSGTRVLAGGKLAFGTAGVISIAEPLFVNGTGLASSPGALYAINGNTRVNFSGPVTVESDSRFRMVSTPVSFTFSNTVAGADVNLWCSPGNAATENADTITFASSLTLGASGSLLKDGPGAVLLNSTVNTWGSTVVSNGILMANGQLDGGTVTVYGGALGGTGTVNGAVDVQSGGSIAPGNNGIGTLTLNSTLASAGSYTMQVNRTNVQTADKLVAASIPVGGTTLNVANTGQALQLGDSFDLLDGTITGPVPAIVLTGNGFAQPNYVWDTSALLSSGVITVATSSIPFLPLQTTVIDIQPTTLGLTWTSFTNQLYTIEYSTNLATTNWSVAQANIAGAGVTNLTTQLLSTIVPTTSVGYSLVQYQMGTAEAQVQDAVKTMAAGPLTAGAGVSLFNANANVTPVYTNPAPPQLQVTALVLGADLATAEANQTWFTFTLTVGSGVTDLDLTSLSLYASRGAASTPRGFAVYVTTPTTTDEPVQGATDLPTARPEYTLFNISLTGLTSLQNLTAGQVVTFKIPFYAPAAGSSLEFDNITVSGDVSPGVGAPYVDANPLFLRIKQQ